MRKPKSRNRQEALSEEDEIKLLNSWIDSGKPNPAANPLSFDPLPKDAPVGLLPDGGFSPFVGCKFFSQLPLSSNTKRGLQEAKFNKLAHIQRASLPRSLCGRDILGAAKTGSGKTLAFVIPVLEKLYKERWLQEDGVGSIIMSPTRDLAIQLFDVLKLVGKYQAFSAGLLVGGRKDVETEKTCVNSLNILVCTPGRLLQHMDETPNFDCSQLQVLVLDEADRVLDNKFKKNVNSIISQLPKNRQTLLFSATQTKSVKDLLTLSLKDPVYLDVHEESPTATPRRLKQMVMEVPIGQKLNMLWTFIRSHLHSRIIVFLSTCKQTRFVFEAFKHLRPGIPLMCIHGRMKPHVRAAVCEEFAEQNSVLFATDVASRGLDFKKVVDWVVQVDRPDVDGYIHRVGRTARYKSHGKSLLFLMPSEMEMIEKLKARKVPIKLVKASRKKMLSISESLAGLLVNFPALKHLAQRAYVTYLKSLYKNGSKYMFDEENKFPFDEFGVSLGLPMTSKIGKLDKKKKKVLETQMVEDSEHGFIDVDHTDRKESINEDDVDGDFLRAKDTAIDEMPHTTKADNMLATRVLKKKKLKINPHRRVGTRVVFDDEGNTHDPLATIAANDVDDVKFDPDAVKERFKKMREEFKARDQEDKILHSKRLKEKRLKEKQKRKRGAEEENEEDDDDDSVSDSEPKIPQNKKIKFDDGDDDDEDNGDYTKGLLKDSISVPSKKKKRKTPYQ